MLEQSATAHDGFTFVWIVILSIVLSGVLLLTENLVGAVISSHTLYLQNYGTHTVYKTWMYYQ